MKQVVTKSIIELNEILSKEKKLEIKDTTPLISEQSNLESIDLVNLFVNLEKNLKEKGDFNLTFDEIINNVDELKTIGSLENFLTNKFKK
jgi:acyl carrier protein|tara:strand:- start:237 stop:506 length:270 start_codon:yes stop_codon:yes gene_type:complete